MTRMPAPGTPLARLGFLTIGTFDPADPGAGHEATLRMIELGEQLGFDSAWVQILTDIATRLAPALGRRPAD
jgi:hypothetical protein